MFKNPMTIVLTVLFCIAGTAEGATYFVPDDYSTIQSAIDDAVIGDVIVVRAGTYVENIDFLGKPITVESESGPGLTIIDGNRNGSVAVFNKGESLLAVLDGFTLTNGSGTFAAAPFNDYCGGGIFCEYSIPTIKNNIIVNNTAVYGGGVCFSQSTSAEFLGNRVADNTATAGAGIFCRYSETTIEGNTIVGNDAGYGGGGIACWLGSSPTLVNNIISSNTTGSGGGGAIRAYNKSAPVVINNTIVGNSSDRGNGDALFCKNGSLTVTNSIIWDNESPDGFAAWVEHGSTPSSLTISYSDFEGGQSAVHVEPGNTLTWNAGMIDSDPLFVDSEDFHLTLSSPCRNSGDSTAAALADTDFEGDKRITQSVVDMGADEFYFHLYTQGTIGSGIEISIRIVGWAGATVRLCQGVEAVTPATSKYGALFLERPVINVWRVGTIPSSGVLILPANIPVTWNKGETLYFQALVGPFGHKHTRFTNMMEIVVE